MPSPLVARAEQLLGFFKTLDLQLGLARRLVRLGQLALVLCAQVPGASPKACSIQPSASSIELNLYRSTCQLDLSSIFFKRRSPDTLLLFKIQHAKFRAFTRFPRFFLFAHLP